MKTGRNDPCPCGSGRKYKHCCLHKPPDPQELLWRRIRRAIDLIHGRLLNCVEADYGMVAMVEAWAEFEGWTEEDLDDEVELPFDDPNFALFSSWFFYDWTLDPAATETSPGAPRDTPIAAHLLATRGHKLDPLERAYIQGCLDSHFSFYDVVNVQPGKGLTLRDVFTGVVTHVLERSMTEQLSPDDVIFARLVPVEGITLIEASGIYSFSPLDKALLLDFRKHLKTIEDPVTAALVKDFRFEVQETYMELYERRAYPEPPQMVNTDGEPLELQSVRYEIDSPQRAFDALRDLAVTESAEELLLQAQYDPNGALERIEFPWTRLNEPGTAMENTILAKIRIDEHLLTAEVNSAARAERFKVLVEERLGDAARYQATVIQSIEKMFEDMADEPGPDLNEQQRELLESPELRAQIESMLQRQYANWTHERIPALGDRTPIEAMRDAEGREMVESLLAFYERGFGEQFPWIAESPVVKLRKELGL